MSSDARPSVDDLHDPYLMLGMTAAALMAIGVGTWSLIAEAPTADEALTSAVRAPASAYR